MKTISLEKDLEFITAIDFGTSTPRLSGVIETNSMPNLVSLSANDNHIQDFIFSNQNNTNISEVRLNDNKLTGNVNTYIPQNATTISYDRNLFTTITSLESYTNLEDFHCSDNNITSDIPALNSNIVIFEMGKNNLTGTIPSLASFNNLKEINLEENQLTGWVGTVWPSALSNQIIKIQNNNLNTSTLDNLLAALVTSGATTGTAEIGGTNSLPTSGNYNPSKLTLESRGWVVDIPGGIDTSFSTSQNYTSTDPLEALELHPDWEGRKESVEKPDQWKMDGANSKIICKNIQDLPGGQQTMRNIRNVHPIVAKVGSKVRISADFDYGVGPFTTDFTRTFMLSLADMGPFPLNDEFVLNYPNESFLISFRNIGGVDVARLYRRKGKSPIVSDYIGDLDLISIKDNDILRLQIDFDVGASAAVSTMTVSYENLSDSTGMTKNGAPANPQVITGFLDVEAERGGKFYTSLISPSSQMKLNIQSGELEDTSIIPAGEITVHNALAKSIW